MALFQSHLTPVGLTAATEPVGSSGLLGGAYETATRREVSSSRRDWVGGFSDAGKRTSPVEWIENRALVSSHGLRFTQIPHLSKTSKTSCQCGVEALKTVSPQQEVYLVPGGAWDTPPLAGSRPPFL